MTGLLRGCVPMLRRHGPIMAILVIVSALASVAVALRQPETFTARTRVLATAQAPQAQAEAASLVSQIEAMATSRDIVAAALDKASVGRRADAVAASVAVVGLGSSALVELSYSDRDPAVAQKVAASLAATVVDRLNTLQAGDLPAVLRDLDGQVAEGVAAVDAARRALLAAPRDPTGPSTLDAAEQRLANLQQQRTDLIVAIGETHRASVVAHPARPTRADSRGVLPRALLGVIAGFLAGMIVGGVRDMIHPCVAGADAVARALDIPLLGTVGAGPPAGAGSPLPGVGRMVALAARRSGVATLAVAPISGGTPLPVLLERVETSLAATGPGGETRPRLLSLDQALAGPPPDRAGLLLVACDLTGKRALSDIRDLASLTAWPLVGVIRDAGPGKAAG